MSGHRSLIGETAAWVRSLMERDPSGHDWWHTDRVRRLALWIARHEGADSVIVELAALLHDVDDWKFSGGDPTAGCAAARRWLLSLEAEPALAEAVARIVGEVSFKGAGVETKPATVEGRVVQDADRLDAIGAIGVARAFAFGGSKGRLLHDPAHDPRLHDSFEAYRDSASPTLSHFYEKLLLLKDRLHTATARQIAADRHAFMEEFVLRFLSEWEGRDLSPAGQ